MDSIVIDGVEVFLSQPTEMAIEWIGQEEAMEQLLASWAVIDESDIPLAPRILGLPGVGKTTLAYTAAKKMNRDVYIFQCTADTRPEDLIITPVLGSRQEIKYHASPLVTAAIKGAVCILDEGNRMPEKSWASLAPLLDARRYVESIIAGIKIQASPEFRIVVTMNQDTSVFDIPEYIGSRLQPKIHVQFPGRDDEIAVLKYNVPFAPKEIVEYVVEFLQKAHKNEESYSVRDGINITRYMLKLSASEKQPLATSKMQAYFRLATKQVIDDEALAYIDGTPKKKPRTAKSFLDLGSRFFLLDDDGEEESKHEPGEGPDDEGDLDEFFDDSDDKKHFFADDG